MSETGSDALEIGPGRNPLLPRLRPDLLGEGGRRIFLERKEESVPGLTKKLSEMGVQNPEIITGDISELSLNEKVDIVLISNVFGEQGIGNMDEERQRVIGKVNIGNEDEIIKRIADMCKTGSKVVVIESYSAPDMGESNFQKLFTDQGFKPMERYIKGHLNEIFDQSTDEGRAEAKAFNDTSMEDAFILVYEKE